MFFFSFFILLISGWVVAASLMAEKTNVGMAVFIADITSMCGFGSDGAAALLSPSLLSCPAYVVHVSLPYSNVQITQAF